MCKAVRSGDYYMFDEFDDTDIHEKDDEEESDEDVPKEMGIGKVSPLRLCLIEELLSVHLKEL